MADTIEHDNLSSTATVGSKAVKWGLIGAIAAFALPALLIGGAGLLLGSGVAAMATGGFWGGLASVGGFAIGGAFVVTGVVVGSSSAVAYGGGAAVAGGLIGVLDGANQVSRENAAHRKHLAGHDFAHAKQANSREMLGFQKGAEFAAAEMEQMAHKREQMAFEAGERSVVEKLQQRMNAQMPGQAGSANGHGSPSVAPDSSKGSGFASKESSLTCESRAEVVVNERQEAATATVQK